MASIFKQTYTKEVNGRRVTRKARKWYAKYRDVDGRWVRKPGYTSKETTQRMADRLEREVEMQRAGLVDPFAVHRGRPLSAHVRDYRAYLTVKGNTAEHVERTISRIETVMDGCGMTLAADMTAVSVSEYLEERRKAGLSVRTSNYYRTAMNGMCRWMVRDQRLPHNPLSPLTNQTVDGPTRERRILTAAEFAKVIDAASKGSPTHRLSGEDRMYLYLLAGYTGFRAKELASLTQASFDIESDAATVTVKATISKRRECDVQPIRADLAIALREWLTSKPADEPLWPGMWYRKAAEMLRADLTAAEIEYRVNGRVADFHSFRSMYVTELVRSGSHPKIVQSLARHSTIELTMQHYTKLHLADVSPALDGLPPLPIGKKRKRRMKVG